MAELACALPLPAGFRAGDILSFHRRDTQELAERVSADGLVKGLIWDGAPACLEIRLQDQEAQVCLRLDGDAGPDAHPEAQLRLRAMAQRMLGLNQPVADFERHYDAHPQLGALLRRQAGLRVPATASPFEALSWAITGQQISVHAAVSLRRKLIAACGLRHSSGLLCHPEAAQVLGLSEETLRAAGFSASKTSAMLALSRAVADGELPLERWLAAPPAEEISERLLALRGIGPWTVNYALLRGFGWLDGSLHGDVAVRRALQYLQGRAEMPTEKQARDWLEPFSPWRALVAAHLWASLALAA